MGKKVTTVNLDEDDVIELQRRGISNISEAARKGIKAMLSDYFDDVEVYIKIQIIEEEIEKIDDTLFNLNRRINKFNTQKKTLQSKLQSLHEEHETVLRVTRLSTLTQRLNSNIILNRFDLNLIESSANELITEIISLNPQFNLEHHILRMKEILDY